MRAKVIMNPQSGEKKSRLLLDAIGESLNNHGKAEVFTTERQGHGQELAAVAADEGYDLVIAAGGDGTVHEVVNGLMAGSSPPLPLGVIPLGSGNDFAFALGISEDFEEAAQQIFYGQARPIDLATISDAQGRTEYWVNNLGIGFDAEVVIRTGAMPDKNSFIHYFIAVLKTIAFHYSTPVLEIQFDDDNICQPTLFLALGNGPRHGGGFLLTPDAEVDDGLIDSCLVDPVGRATMVRMLAATVKGTHITSQYVSMRQSGRVLVHSATPLPIHTDGEMFAYPENDICDVTIAVQPLALSVMV